MTKQYSHWLRAGVSKMATIHFVYVGAYMVQIVVYDAWKLITPQAVMRRWIMGSLVLSVNTVVWYLVHSKPLDTTAYKLLAWALIVADIALASFNVYEQRGMASRAVALYAIPLIVSTVLLSRSALLATAVLSIVAYATTAVSYFVLNFNEGYKIELYGEVGSYCILFVIMAALLWVTVRHRQHP